MEKTKTVNLPKYIFLFGHRQQHGKDTCTDIAFEMLTHGNKNTVKKTYFAKLLKQQVAQRYGLDFNRMGDDDYKQFCPSHINPKADGTPRTVRDILIEEGCKAREIWGDTWAAAVYTELFKSGCDYGLISDYRFPNESACFENTLKNYLNRFSDNEGVQYNTPKIIKVLVHRPDGLFKNDGADNELPDLDHNDEWDYVIMNDNTSDDWRVDLEDKLVTMFKEYNIL